MRIPVATYRLQFNRDFTLVKARELIGYLKNLGISDLYASPLFLAGPESSHGYDVCNFNQINPSLGTPEDLGALSSGLREAGMGLLLDIVPNHMGADPANCWWIDVLRNGAKSRYAGYFDINWNSETPGLGGKVLLPLLGDHYASVLERGELRVTAKEGEVSLFYFDKRFPLSPESQEKFEIRGDLTEVESRLARLNGRVREPGSFNDLHALIEMQNYRLAYWKTGPQEINYRRFFDVTGLVSVRVEDKEVFEASHELVFQLLQAGSVTGLRIDHPDGLRDPRTYLERLQNSAGKKTYVVVEKILSGEERLPEDWPAQGTTGYDYLNYLNGVFIKPENGPAFTDLYREFTGVEEDFPTLAFRSKQEVLNRLFPAEVTALTRRLKRISSQTRHGVDLSETDLRGAIVDFIAAFPVYRNYVAGQGQTAKELARIREAIVVAKERTAQRDGTGLEFLGRILSLENYPDFTEALRAEGREFAIRFQQLSGPATAKGLEDTAFYRYSRFISLNEVGGEPGRFGVSADQFHEYNRYQCEHWPHSLLATSTHDTKRGEDVRARLNVLSEIPDEWRRTVLAWRDQNAALKQNDAPNLSDEYLLYQTLAGTWQGAKNLGIYVSRIEEYMVKAIREAKNETSWTEPNDSYEKGVTEFVRGILSSRAFTDRLEAFSAGVSFFGALNSIAQVILKSCSPGVPDFYQGTELWDLTLVDPDNRRPVDFQSREGLLRDLRSKSAAELLSSWETGAIKMFAMTSALTARHRHRDIFEGTYRPLAIEGERESHMLAFAREGKGGRIIVAAPRFLRTLAGGRVEYPSSHPWGNTAVTLPEAHRKFRNLITGEEHQTLRAADLFKTFPGAILLPLD